MLWTGNVESLPVAHTIYINEVALEFVGEHLVLRGKESSITTLQIFTPSSGERLFADTRYW